MIDRKVFGPKSIDELSFQRGYCLTSSDNKAVDGIKGIEGWRSIEFSNYYLKYCPTLGCEYATEGEVEIVMLGYALNPFDGANNNREIITKLALELEKNEDGFYDYLNELSGRFLLFVVYKDNHFALQDATALRTCFYTETDLPFTLSSHSGLIGELYDLSIDPLVLEITNSPKYHLGGVYLPGVMSSFQEVKQLLSNTQYNVKNRQVARFFPIEGVNERELDDSFIEEASTLLNRQNDMIFSRFNIALSLTAGLDSRLSLSFLKNHKEAFSSFTYTIWGNRSHKIDADVASDMSKKFSFNHEHVKYSKNDGNDTVSKSISRSHGGIRRGPAVHEAFRDFFPSEYINLRSSVSEVFRCYWQKNPVNRNAKLPLDKILNLYKKDIKGICEKPWIEFVEVQKFPQERFHGYDPIDLFYWEHRMSNWFSQVLLDADTSHESFVPYNNRKLLIFFLSVPFEDRLEDKIPEKLIRHNWPELLEFPINPKEYPVVENISSSTGFRDDVEV